MSKEFQIKISEIKDILSFTPEKNPSDSNEEPNIFIKVENKKIIFKINSFRYTIKYTKDIDFSDSVELVLPLKKLQDLLKTYSEEEIVSFKENENEGYINFSIGKNKGKIVKKFFDGYKDFYADEKIEAEEITIPAIDLLTGLKKTEIAIANDKTRYFMNGTNFELYKDDQNNIYTHYVATDSKILSVVNVKKDNWKELKKNNIIPKQSVVDIIKILDKGAENATISFYKKKFILKVNDFEASFKLIEADFPETDNLIPYKNSKEIKLDLASLISEIKKVSIMSDDATGNIKMTFSDNNLDLESSDINGNNATSYISCEYSGEKFDIYFDSKSLVGILNQFTEEKVILKIENPNSAILIRQEQDENFIFVMMPIVM